MIFWALCTFVVYMYTAQTIDTVRSNGEGQRGVKNKLFVLSYPR